jgi:hypothetical protein
MITTYVIYKVIYAKLFYIYTYNDMMYIEKYIIINIKYYKFTNI